MSAETLREAAALMRARALDATEGTWSAYDGTAAPTHVRSRWTDSQGRRCQCVVAEAHAARDESQAQDAFYITSMQPAVAVAVADLLDVIEAGYQEYDPDGPGENEMHFVSAWADNLAHTFLDCSRPGLGTAGVTGAQPDEPASQVGRPAQGGHR